MATPPVDTVFYTITGFDPADPTRLVYTMSVHKANGHVELIETSAVKVAPGMGVKQIRAAIAEAVQAQVSRTATVICC